MKYPQTTNNFPNFQPNPSTTLESKRIELQGLNLFRTIHLNKIKKLTLLPLLPLIPMKFVKVSILLTISTSRFFAFVLETEHNYTKSFNYRKQSEFQHWLKWPWLTFLLRWGIERTSLLLFTFLPFLVNFCNQRFSLFVSSSGLQLAVVNHLGCPIKSKSWKAYSCQKYESRLPFLELLGQAISFSRLTSACSCFRSCLRKKSITKLMWKIICKRKLAEPKSVEKTS